MCFQVDGFVSKYFFAVYMKQDSFVHSIVSTPFTQELGEGPGTHLNVWEQEVPRECVHFENVSST